MSNYIKKMLSTLFIFKWQYDEEMKPFFTQGY